MQVIIHAQILTDNGFVTGKNLYFENGKILKISADSPASDDEVIDAKGNYLVPGFIDLQIYGSGGALFSAFPTVETLSRMDADLRAKGTTSFLTCLATNTPEVFDRAIKTAKLYRSNAQGFMGLHLEGPFLNPKRRGAHIEKYIRKAQLEEIQQLLYQADGIVKMMTIAPEMQDKQVISYLANHGVVLSMGHSDASFDEATAAFNNGVTTTTHLFNAMPPIHHRAPGIPGAVFNHDRAYASIIADGNHVDFEVIRFAQKLMKHRLFLITDAVTACSVGPYQHRLDGDKFVTENGTLSGSNITMLQSVRNCVAHCGIDLEEAIRMATTYPARVLGVEDKKGRLLEGFCADMLILDKGLNLIRVITRLPGSE